MNLIDRYLQDEGNKDTIINSQNGLSTNALGGHYISMDTYVDTSGTIISDAGLSSIAIGSYSDAITTSVSNIAVRSDLDAIESRLDTLESVSLMGFSAAPISPITMEVVPMTAVFQGAEYEIILSDGSIIRTTNFQVRQVRNEED